MNILIVDEDSASLKKIKAFLSKEFPDHNCFYFDSSLSALAKAREEEIDVAILDTELDELGGLDLGK